MPKKVAKSDRKRAAPRRTRRAKGSHSLPSASMLGIAPAHILQFAARVPTAALAAPLPPSDLPIGSVKEIFKPRRGILHQPLVSPRTSFWLGVGLGIITTGVLGYIAWQLFSIEILETLMLG